jgi:glycerol-3-phosphate dehydrogenase
LDDVVLCSAGLVPFGDNDPDARHLKYAHRSRIVDHAHERGLDGLISLIGVRYTTAPVEAVEVLDLILARLGRKAPASQLESRPVRGGAFTSFAKLQAEIALTAPPSLGAASLSALAHNHGSAAGEVLSLMDENPDWSRTLGTSHVTAAEIVHAQRREMALTLADAVFRRTDLCTAGHPGEAALIDAARIMAQAAGWGAARSQAELDLVRRRLRDGLLGRTFLDVDAPPAPALVA